MLEEPCSEDICSYFGEDSSLFGILFRRWVVVITTISTISAPYTGITGITWNQKVRVSIGGFYCRWQQSVMIGEKVYWFPQAKGPLWFYFAMPASLSSYVQNSSAFLMHGQPASETAYARMYVYEHVRKGGVQVEDKRTKRRSQALMCFGNLWNLES